MSNNLKDHKIGSKAIRDRSSYNKINNNKNSSNNFKDSSNSNNQSYGEEYLSGFSWPPRSYTCSFCNREFRSAQALGGHMNVHRRDRARLRMSPPRDGQYPFLSLNLSHNPNPNFSTPYLVSPFFALPSLISPPLSSLSSPSSSTFLCDMKRWGMDGTLTDPLNTEDSKKRSAKSFSLVEESDDFTEDGCKVSKKADILMLDLGIGLISDAKEDVDLELRLGY